MKYIYPDFYFDFKCIADKCRHSCCIDWEIDIDEESLEFYQSIESELGEDIRKNISLNPPAHFILTDEKRCPFLQNDGLCRIICEMGEGGICDICREHPRFYNSFSDREFAGLGLCCEEAARMVLEGEDSLAFLCEDDGEEETPDELEKVLFELEEKVYAILSDDRINLYQRINNALELMGEKPCSVSFSAWADFLLSLERLDDSWTQKLLLLRDRGDEAELPACLDNIRYERLMEYFVYRHFGAASDTKKAAAVLKFCALSVFVIAVLDELLGFDMEHTRLYSSEIEYSDENIELILAKIATMSQ